MNPTAWKSWCSGIVYELVINQLYTPFGRMLCIHFQEDFIELSDEERSRLIHAIQAQVIEKRDTPQAQWVHYMQRLTD